MIQNLLLFSETNLTNQVLEYSYIGIGVFGVMLMLFVGLHIWWNRKQKKKLEYVGHESIFRFLKINVFAIFATIWACDLFSAIIALIKMH
ncbi:hypothetical protein [Spiroplasma eriocheiris]|uniref:Transmembrane protein n=1 Tax=Spiroplasma eriocheiris TaxID=315358 RepID=A0A0H3XJ22_9MOLU|nr:hypothetical protein [Spiroplasma eriocheiris]AHF58117.1 hypothetical protein SPE_1000 [Spiroplasma eriocheiris CCTCC M 207170]AKM54555.1 hypothetical protein SERIO_v1c09970 [Spiroplasma eriocheiris]